MVSIKVIKNKNKNKNKNKRNSRRNLASNNTHPTPDKALVVYKRNTTRRIRPPMKSNRGQIESLFTSQACGLFNPFCLESIGAKIPDVSSAKTLTANCRMLVPIGTTAAGSACFSFIPALSIVGSYANSISDGTVVTMTGLSSVPFYDDYVATCQRYRVVSFGCKFVPSESFMVQKGVVIATEVDSSPAFGYNIASVNTSPVNLVRSVTGPPLLWVSRVTDIEYTDFVDISSGNPANARTLLTLAFTGCTPSATIGYVEVIINVELTAKAGTIGALFPTSAAKSNPRLVNAAANLSSTVEPFHSGSDTSYSELISTKLKEAIRKAGPQALEFMLETLL